MRCSTAQADTGAHSCAPPGLDGLSQLGVQAADLMFSTSSHVAGLVCMEHAGLAGRPGFGFAEFSYGQCWKMLVCSFLSIPLPTLKIFVIKIRGARIESKPAGHLVLGWQMYVTRAAPALWPLVDTLNRR